MAKDFSGMRFGKLLVMYHVAPLNGRMAWNCLCDCGNYKIVNRQNLKQGHTKSCGCLIGIKNITHGKTKSRVYRIWRGMMRRCYVEKDPGFKYYGKRGITVDERWHKFENFLADMGEPGLELSLDRINNDGNYKPGNCRWASHIEQHNNTSGNRFILFNGFTLTLAQWARKIGIKDSTLQMRLNKHLWSIEKSLTTPTRFKTLPKPQR